MISFVLPEPPSANRYWRKWRNRMVLSAEAQKYKAEVMLLAIAQGKRRPTTSPVALTLRWYRGRKAGDLSNRIKVIEDALNGVAYVDDKQVVELHAFRHDTKVYPRLEIEIEERST